MSKYCHNPRQPKREGKKVTVGNVTALPPGRGATVQLKDGTEVALFNVQGKFYAIENFCPHRGSPLADSRLYGHIVECDSHGWRFDVTNGTCLTRNDCSIESYEVVIEDEMIKIII
jgi:nitrite reductase/ring-hydroxylating ferredoxin subunit